MKNMKKNKHLHIQIFTVTRLNKYVHVFIIYIDKIIFFSQLGDRKIGMY